LEDAHIEEMKKFHECLKNYGVKTFQNLLSAFLIWLFGNLVFIPLASSLNWQTRVFCTLIFFTVFTILIARSIPGLKKLIDTFSFFPAKKYSSKRNLSYENSLILFRNSLYIASLIIFYLLYLPFLSSFHPSISGIVLILILIWIIFPAIRILSVLSYKLLEWLVSEKQTEAPYETPSDNGN